ncbi:TPA: hypothetical protein L4W69_006237 [Pseudomonas aeruginosa]|nr:hypothetical protein [Pseudomonas aeruginosa]
MTKTKKKSEWAKLPLRWIHKGGLGTFTDMKLKKTRVPEGQEWTEAWLHDREARKGPCRDKGKLGHLFSNVLYLKE